MAGTDLRGISRNIGNVIAPARFVAFAVILVLASAGAVCLWGWRLGVMIGFDVASLVFLASCWSLLGHDPVAMRRTAKQNDANRPSLLAVTFVVVLVILAVVANELMEKGNTGPLLIVVIVATLAIAWLFSNTVYAVHYAHMYYSSDAGKDAGGLAFPGTPEPGYWDFVYFAFCLGMTFQTSDVEITDPDFRRVVTLHCLEAFIYNLGILAFTINVLSGG